MSKKYNVAVVGATGNVGREILKLLDERNFPVNEVFALASSRSVGREVSFGEKNIKVQDLEYFDFSQAQIGLFSPGASVSAIHAPRAAKQGCVVIDNTSQFRMDADKLLVVPEVNGASLKDFRKTNIIANPNCSTVLLFLLTNQFLAPVKKQWTNYSDKLKAFTLVT
jgi:aspartate-semialdehyde dehydrogenase